MFSSPFPLLSSPLFLKCDHLVLKQNITLSPKFVCLIYFDSLTWDASNIDAFASRVQCTLDLLEDTTNNINQVIEEDIQILLRRIEEQDMFAMDIGEGVYDNSEMTVKQFLFI